MKHLIFIVFLAVLSCSSTHDKIKQGKILFNKSHLGANNVIGCIACHSLKPDILTVGPSLYKIKLRAGLLIENQTAEQYIRQSIINPDAYIVSGYMPAIMFAHYQTELTATEIQQLVAFLLTQ
ncbi:hypothetical protein MNBD_GAMMA01-2129 [hydrothermal vent metagenome]|uniref:Cytochrome c domain-containing protein n=1 Tax=hydrothermal vent metagenome TaxID=652676 RepID=A0A3B0V999_9ZZZZ